MTIFERAAKPFKRLIRHPRVAIAFASFAFVGPGHIQPMGGIAFTEAVSGEARCASDLGRLRRIVTSQQDGRPDYRDMEAPVAELAARHAQAFHVGLIRLGELQSIEFLREIKGECVYEAWFANGRMLWGVAFAPAGKIRSLRARLMEHR